MRTVPAIPGAAVALDAGGVMAVVVVVVVAVLLVFAGRRWVLQRRWATFECSFRVTPGSVTGGSRTPGGWALGVGAYGDGVLRWYRLLSLRMRPCLVLDRRQVEILARRRPAGGESRALIPGHVVLAVSADERRLELAMKPEAVMSLTAWLETASRV